MNLLESYINYLERYNYKFRVHRNEVVDFDLIDNQKSHTATIRMEFSIPELVITLGMFQNMNISNFSPDYFCNTFNKFSNVSFLIYDMGCFSSKIVTDFRYTPLTRRFNDLTSNDLEDIFKGNIIRAYSQSFIAKNLWERSCLERPKNLEDFITKSFLAMESKRQENTNKLDFEKFRSELNSKNQDQLLDELANLMKLQEEKGEDKLLEIKVKEIKKHLLS